MKHGDLIQRFCFCLFLFAASCRPMVVRAEEVTAAKSPLRLQCVAEASDYRSTATYGEVMDLCRSLDDSSPHIRLTQLGTSSQGRELPLLVISRRPPAEPREVPDGSISILVLGNIHAGEVCGKEAISLLACEIVAGKHGALLDGAVLLCAPIYNADGNQPFSRQNRPAQHGPDGGVGLRVNAQGLDLNRDHVKLESPESRAFAQALTDWDPAVVIDTHTTNGSYHRYDLTYDGPRNAAAPSRLVEYARDEFLPAISERMLAATGYKSFYYGNFSDDHRQWRTYPALTRYGTQYVAVRGRISILSEAYAYISFRDRVLATRQFLLDCLHQSVDQRESILDLIDTADRQWREGTEAHQRFTLRSQAAPLSRRFTALGFDDQSLPPDAKRGTLPTVPQNYSVEFVAKEQPTTVVSSPFAYAIPPTWTSVIANLEDHGVVLSKLDEAVNLDVTAARIEQVHREDHQFQGHTLTNVETKSEPTRQRLVAGTVIVQTRQRLGRLAMLLLEPMSQDGLVTWNFFDKALEKGALFPVVRIETPATLRLSPLARE